MTGGGLVEPVARTAAHPIKLITPTLTDLPTRENAEAKAVVAIAIISISVRRTKAECNLSAERRAG